MDAASLLRKLARITRLQFVAESSSGSGWNGRGAGEVRVEQPSEEILIFHEWGEWTSAAGKCFRFSNTYRWIRTGPQSVRLEHLRFGTDQPVFLFELAPADDDAWKSVSPHVCSEDCYTAELRLIDGGLRLHWTIAGAQKQESIEYEYLRRMNVSGWVWNENFRPYLRFLGSLTNYELSDEELSAIESSLVGTSADLGEWRPYVLPGCPQIAMSLAYEVGFDNVQIQFDCDEQIGPRAEAAMAIMMNYSLTPRHP